MGFRRRWRQWIMKCVLIASILVLVKGPPTKIVKMQKGLQSLSPFLFNMVLKVFSYLMGKTMVENICSGFLIGD
ncbi:Uncharacterized protein TCM_036157 [Theobroma cacao]|uniref:Uncharacterized protein n=1 Tax=Theobroma cacao TaxID=3641 RepID=A0A061FR50_THECC|nr:Uncharacterized protein TCM_036157 [Theobroma cacao]